MSFITLPWDDFLSYRNNKMGALKLEYMERIISTMQGNSSPQIYLKMLKYVEALQEMYEQLEATHNKEEEMEIFPMEEDLDDRSYYRIFIHERFLNVAEENPILEPSNED